MRRMRGFSLLLTAAALSSTWAVVASAQVPPVGASAQLRDAAGRVIVTAVFREAPDQVLISLAFLDRATLTGAHGIHIHGVGRCDPPDFASAGDIFNPFGKLHGLRNPDGPMAGDVPNLTIGATGLAAYNTSAPLVKLSPGPASLLRPGGTALLIFALADDDRTQPEGNAGARIACGIITPGDLGLNAPDATQQPASSADLDQLSALLIGAMGALLIGAGLVLRRA